jgi:DNA-binding IclR family transcriptional regulator
MPRTAASPPPVKDASTHDGDSQHIVPALRRGLAVLRMFTRERRVISLPEIVRELDVPRATAFRLAHTLEADGYLKKAPHSTAFQLGINTLLLGFEYLSSQNLIEVARPVLEDLRDRVDASVHLGVQDGAEMVYVATAPSRHRLRSNVMVGERRPMHAATIGWVLLFDSSVQEVRRDLRGVDLRAQFAHAPADADALHAEVQALRPLGYVAFRARFIPGMFSVAAPVRDASGRIVAGINVSDYESIPAMGDLEGKVKDELLRAAATISRGLGYRAAAA